MTSDSELRRMLGELADETPEVPAHEWLAGTRHKVRVRRRVRWAATGAAAALIIGVGAAVVPQLVDDAAPAPEPVEPADPEEPREWRFGDGIDTDRVIASRLNEPGESELHVTETVRRADLGEVVSLWFCRLPEQALAPGDPEIRLAWRLHGVKSRHGRVSCRAWSDDAPIGRKVIRYGGLLPATGAKRSGEKPRQDEAYSVSMWLEQAGERVHVPGAEFGVAFYWQCYPTTTGLENCDDTFSPDKFARIGLGDIPSLAHKGRGFR